MFHKRIVTAVVAIGLALGLVGVAGATTSAKPVAVPPGSQFWPCANFSGLKTATPLGDLCFWNPITKTITIAGKSTIKLPPKTPKDTGKTGGSPPKPCTAKQLKQGMTNDINGNCMPKATGSYKCVSGDGDVIYVSGSQCPKGYSHPSIWNLWDSLRF